MITPEQHNTLTIAINKWGETAQLDMVVEECSELIKAVQKYKRKKDRPQVENLIEETVDVLIMIEQLKIIFGISSEVIHQLAEAKISRLKLKL